MNPVNNTQIKINNAKDGIEFKELDSCKAWLQSFFSYIESSIGREFEIRLNAYDHFGTCVNIDLFTVNDLSITLTVALTTDVISLELSITDPIYIQLPGIIDVFHLIREMLIYFKQPEKRINFLNISLPVYN